MTDGSSWDDDDGDIVANATLASTDENLYFEVIAGATNIGWGWPEFVITRNGEFKIYESVIIVSTTMTAIDVSGLQNEGFRQISDNTLTAEKAFYKVITPQYTTKGSKMDFNVKIPVDSSAATGSTAYVFKIWIIDFQNVESVEIGSVTTSAPTAYGFVTAYGPGVMIYAKAYSTSSGAGAGHVLKSYLTTP